MRHVSATMRSQSFDGMALTSARAALTALSPCDVTDPWCASDRMAVLQCLCLWLTPALNDAGSPACHYNTY
jgi:hypothetical protein